MKKLFLISFFFASLVGNSQITMKPKRVLTPVANEWQFVKMYTNFVTENVKMLNDSVMYSFSKIPDEIKERNFKTGYKQVGDTLFQFTKRARVDLTYGRKLIVYQYVRKLVYKDFERDDNEKMLFYLKTGKKLGVKNAQFFRYAPIDTIVNHLFVPKDVSSLISPKDSIK